MPKNWCFWTMVLEKTLESPLDSKEIQPVHPKGDQSWVFIGRTDAEAETPILWPPDAKSWLIWKDSDAGKDWEQEEKGTREDEMVGWHHSLNEHEFGVNSRSRWWTGKPGVLRFTGLQRVGHDWVNELNWNLGSELFDAIKESHFQAACQGNTGDIWIFEIKEQVKLLRKVFIFWRPQISILLCWKYTKV